MSTDLATTSQQYLTFRLAGETFALAIAKVREVLEHRTLTKLPQTPATVRGVINLRGHVVPVVDLNLRFGNRETETTVDTCIVITEVEIDGTVAHIGALVDAVDEVFELEDDRIEPPPRMGLNLDTSYVRGMGKRDDDFVIVLDADRVFDARDAALSQSERDETSV
ncbi:MAG TPA: chemotaxis protein CheW [Candidatus Krumholzibacteria bacterium]|nr:chemotaxis protein CheW [Candidatus Krumholzibacteria bacterium]